MHEYEEYLNKELTATTVDGMSDSELRDLIARLGRAFSNEQISGAAFVGRNLATAVERVLTTRRKVKVIWKRDQLPSLRASDKKRK